MSISDKRKESMYKYAKENLKRVPLDMQISDYEKLKAAADKKQEKVNTYIKIAIAQRIERDKAASQTTELPQNTEKEE